MDTRYFEIDEGKKVGYYFTGYDWVFFSQTFPPTPPERVQSASSTPTDGNDIHRRMNDDDLSDGVQSAPSTPKGRKNRYPEHNIHWKGCLDRHIIIKWTLPDFKKMNSVYE